MQSDFDLLATLIAILNNEQRVVGANAALEGMLGISRRKLFGLPFGHFMKDSAALDLAFSKGNNSPEQSVFRFQAALQDLGRGEQIIEVHANLTKVDAHGDWLLEMWPQSEQAKHYQDGQLHELAETNKMLLRNLAHEVKNPLGGIRGAAQLLGMETVEPELHEYTQVIMHEADRLQALVDRLLEPHRHPQSVEPVNIHEVCEHVRSLILMEYPKGLMIEQNYDISLPDVQGDKNQLIQVLLNIVQNAALVLRPKIELGLAHIELRTRVARQVHIGKKLHKLALELHVIDNGPGIDPEIRERIFHPLVTGRDDGTGLGLSLAQTFIQRHHGMIECDSVPGKTSFVITIPLP
ncbi:PAS domain-containing sensor histidine kinase [Lampropedia aestuarii]|uniref:histidine kinase n=1 Tax=Lampropedia aestuarii TaxID=2562762 RepID=A0A4S5BER1_9BURK|nr:nitrogen regulation protein NR(II) [Lampropedia aestuarii]THJ30757.1 PAS domain-containing sensor histidine kinase [Lampropedia aestuarii]